MDLLANLPRWCALAALSVATAIAQGAKSFDKAALAEPIARRDFALRGATVAIKDGRANVVLDTKALAGTRALKVLNAAGDDVSRTVVTQIPGRAETTLRLTPNQCYVIPAPEDPAVAPTAAELATGLAGKRGYFSGRMVMAVSKSGSPDSAEIFIGVPFVEFENEPLMWDEAAGGYSSRLLVGIDPAPESKVRSATFPAQTIALRISGAARITPALVTVTQSDTNGYRNDVVVTSPQPGGKITVFARSTYGEVVKEAMVGDPLPWRLIGATLIGAALGGVARGFKPQGRKRVRWPRVIGEACVVGLIVAAAVWAGLSVGAIPRALARTEIGMFAIAALAGYTGTLVIDLIAQKIFPKKPEAQPA